jgi:hypothetical protein
MKKPAKKAKIKVKSTPKAKTLKKPINKMVAKSAAKKIKVVAKSTKTVPVKKALKPLDKNKTTAKVLSKASGKSQASDKIATQKSVVMAPPSVESPKKSKKNQNVVVPVVVAAPVEEVVLTNADGKEYCRVHDCDNESTTESYCRYHYLALWKRNKVKAKILQGGKLDKYIEDLTAKYPDKYLEMLRKDLASEKDFNLIVAEMDVEDSGDEADNEEETSRFIEEVRGGMPTPDDDEGF